MNTTKFQIQEGNDMSREERSILQQLIFTYLIGEMEMGPIPAQKKVESMTDEEIERFFE